MRLVVPPSSHKVTAHTMLPTNDQSALPVVVENLVTRFKYWDQTIQEGIQYRGDLYKCVKAYAVTERAQAFAEGQAYVMQRQKVCITLSEKSYTLWVCLRTPSV